MLLFQIFSHAQNLKWKKLIVPKDDKISIIELTPAIGSDGTTSSEITPSHT